MPFISNAFAQLAQALLEVCNLLAAIFYNDILTMLIEETRSPRPSISDYPKQ